MDLFTEISLLIVFATFISLIVRFFKQPLIVGYILTGVLVGPYVLNVLQARDEMELFSKIGIAVLLFIVGLTLNPEVMREVGKASVITGLGQIVFTSVIGFFIVRSLGFDMLSAGYVAVALTFSSTIIILKLLSDRGDMGKLYGKISIGFLLVQDVVATLLLLLVTVGGAAALAGVSETLVGQTLVLFGKGALLALGLYAVSKYLLPSLTRFVAGSQEVLFIFSLAWGLGLSALFHYLGFSIEIGALIAGVTLAVSPFSYEIASRMKPLRDFFIMLFFILLGSQLIFDQFASLAVSAAVLSLFVLVGNPIIVIILMNLMGYRTRTAFMSGLTVAQISEFSLILVALAYAFGHVSLEVVSLVTLVGVVTITGSTYLIQHAERVYAFLAPALKLIAWRKSHIKEGATTGRYDVIIFGYDRVGHHFVETTKKLTQNYLVVDYNPAAIEQAQSLGVTSCYGDAEDVEFLEEINLSEAKLVISTVPDLEANMILLKHYRLSNSKGLFITLSHNITDTKSLYESGASYVVMPHYLGAFHAAELIEKHQFSQEAFAQVREEHLQSFALRS